MKKRLCGWCENEVDKDGELCPKCRKKYEENNKELERIEKEYDELFANYPDCLSQIAFVKGLQKENEVLKQELAVANLTIKKLIKSNISNVMEEEVEPLLQYIKLEAEKELLGDKE